MKTFKYMLALTISGSAFAQANNTANVRNQVLIPGVNLPMMQAGPETTVNVTETNIARLMSEQMKEFFRVRKEDGIFLKEQLVALEKKLVEYNGLVYATGTGGKKSYSDLVGLSLTNKFVSLQDFVAVRGQILEARRAIEARLATLRGLSAALPSARVEPLKDKSVEIPAQFNIDFANMAKSYEEQLKVVDTYLNSQQVILRDAANNLVTTNGVDLDRSKMTLIGPNEAEAEQNRINTELKGGQLARDKQDAHTTDLIELTKTLLEIRGVGERFRLSNKDVENNRDAAVARLKEGMLAKSYMRLKYRIPVGSFNVTYKPTKFNLSELTFHPKDYINKFSDLPVRNQDQAERALRSFETMVMAGSLRRGEENTFLIGSLLWGWDAIRGWNTLSKTGLQIFRMLYADLKEDIMMMTGEGVESFQEQFKTRYTSNDPAERAKMMNAICSIDSEKKCANGQPSASLGQINGGTLLGKAREAYRQTQNFAGRLQAAQKAQVALDDLQGLRGGEIGQKLENNTSIIDEMFR